MSTGAPTASRPAAPLRHRVNVANLDPGQLAGVRRAFAAAQAISDDRGYEHWAGIHGLPLPMYCQHGNPLFLPWHRAYLYHFELALRDRVPELHGWALPWWQWSSLASHEHGIPEAYRAEKDPDGQDNPLHSAAVAPLALEQAASQGDTMPARTVRQPGPPSELPGEHAVQTALALADFTDFSAQLEDIHNAVHDWVGGHMGQIPLAAYDPIFWAHHCYIDRLWRLWQLRHPGATVPRALHGQALPPFRMTVAETLEMTNLGYDYATMTTSPH